MSLFKILPKVSTSIALVVAAAALVACGGDDSSTTTSSTTTPPEEVTKSFLLALAEGDGATACSHASQAALDRMAPQGACEEAVAAAARDLPEAAFAKGESATYTVSAQTDTTATVTVTRNGKDETFSLVMEDGEWKVDS